MDYKIILGITAVVLGIIAYIPYLVDVLSGKTKPHAFTWILWGFVESIIFIIQVLENGGPGAWAGGIAAIVCFLNGGIALVKGDRNWTRLDWLTSLGALISLVLWVTTGNPLNAVIFLIVTDALAFSMTFRKSYYAPFDETLKSYLLAAVKSIIAIFALEALILTNWLFLAHVAFINLAFVTMCFIRRKQLQPNNI